MFWLGFYVSLGGATWILCAIVCKDSVGAAVGAAALVSGVVLMVGDKVLTAIRELKDSLKK